MDSYFNAIAERDLTTGSTATPTRHPRWFTTAHLHLPDELGGQLTDAGFESVKVLALGNRRLAAQRRRVARQTGT